MRRGSLAMAIALLGAAPLLLAQKCIDADPVLTGTLDAAPSPDAPAGGDGSAEDAGDGAAIDGSTNPDAIVPDSGAPPANACADAGTARINIRDLEYQIQCGCEETSGKTCTVPAGTRVIWIFADSEDHDVASVGGLFPQSGERGSGTYSFTFATAGDYPYLCNIHAAAMNGYTIRVR